MRIWYKTYDGAVKAQKRWNIKHRKSVIGIDLTPKKYKQYILQVEPKKKRRAK